MSTLNKLAGNYYTESLVSALVQKEKEPTKLEMLVRNNIRLPRHLREVV